MILIFFGLVIAEYPPWKIFNVYYRDLPMIHPDVEGPYANNFPQKGLLNKTLKNGVPQFIPYDLRTPNQLSADYYDFNLQNPPVLSSSGKIAISNQGPYYFDEFFNDVPGINIGFNSTLNFTLVDPEKGIYEYRNTRFFPLDGMGFGVSEAYEPPTSSDGPHNFGFSTQISLSFFYTGGEMFSFSGDDDLWVFINGELTSCDLGGIHNAARCTIYLDTLLLQTNATHKMDIFHIERHSDESNFIVTTSIVPVNVKPRADNISKVLQVNKAADVVLFASDADGDRLSYIIKSLPQHGSLYPTNTNGMYTFVPEANYSGTDSFIYVANDGLLNSSDAFVGFNITQYGAISGTIQVSKVVLDAKIGDKVYVNIEVNSSDVVIFLNEHPKCGNVIFLSNGTMIYEGQREGMEKFNFSVVDNLGNLGTSNVTGQVNFKSGDGQSTGAIIGIVIGSIVGASLVGGVAAYFIYHRFMAARFAAKWKSDWSKGSVSDNPLFVPDTKETVNPLYMK